MKNKWLKSAIIILIALIAVAILYTTQSPTGLKSDILSDEASATAQPTLPSPIALTCHDNDTNNYMKKWLVSLSSGQAREDYCSADGTAVYESLCSSQDDTVEIVSDKYPCANGCVNGRCLAEPISAPKTEEVAQVTASLPPVKKAVTCTDTDSEYSYGGAYYFIPGNATLSDGQLGQDYCHIDGATLFEALCVWGNTTPSIAYQEFNCQYGCNNGACLKAPTGQTTVSTEWSTQAIDSPAFAREISPTSGI